MNSYGVEDDDHYIANARNAHIDTTEFEKEVFKIARNPKIRDQELLKQLYQSIFCRTAAAPVQPDDGALLCRYLSPIKFIDFLHSRRIAFPTANQFADRWECRVPEDYDRAVLRVFNKTGRSGEHWAAYVRAQASTWNISCWTEFYDYFDDHLMWETYAGGKNGIGITIRYGILKERLKKAAEYMDLKGSFHCGRVNYQTISLLPFNKHNMFRNEQEIRFAFKSSESQLVLVSVAEILGAFGVRISPAASVDHRDAIRAMWLKYGGADRIQQPS